MPTVADLLQVFVPCWGVNVALNSLYFFKKKYPVFKAKDAPLDRSAVFFDGKRVLGESTTVYGIGVAAIMVGALWLVASFSLLSSFIIAFGVYFGHALGSFIKRRFGYADGQFMPVVDHADSVLFATALLASFHVCSWGVVLIGTSVTLIFQPAWNFLWYSVGFRKYPL